MDFKLTCFPLNVRGLNKTTKRRKAFRLFHNQKFDAIFLQETYSTSQTIQSWENEWGGKIYANHGTNHSKGVAFLSSLKLNFALESIQRDQNGCVIILSIVLDGNKFVLANIYSPDDQNAQRSFYANVSSLLHPFANENIILGGDFNCCMSADDKSGGNPFTSKQHIRNEIKNLTSSYNLVDAWRKQNTHKQEFTWRNTNLKISCRFEYLYVSNNLINSFTDTNITETTISDHSAVTILLTTTQSKRGPGFWKFNNSLLTDEKFTESLEKKVPEFKIKYSCLNYKGLLWEMIKMEI